MNTPTNIIYVQDRNTGVTTTYKGYDRAAIGTNVSPKTIRKYNIQQYKNFKKN